MQKYRIYMDFGFAGTSHTEIIEAESLEDAEDIVWEMAAQQVSTSAEEIDEDGDEPD